MAILSNINGKFAVDSTGAIELSGDAGAANEVLVSGGAGAAPTWVVGSTVIGGPYLPLTGGILTGATSTSTGITFTVGGILTTDKILIVKGQNLAHGASQLRISQENTTTSELRFYGADASTAGILRFLGSSSDGSVGGTRLTINADGNVGIGATDPVKKLDVRGQLAISNSASSYWYLDRNDSTGYFEIFDDGNTNRLTIDTSGNVGIGTAAPAAKLEVNVASGDGILIKSADVSTFKMKGGGGVYDWGLATTNLAASDFGIYKSNAVGGDPITAGTAQLYFKSTGSTTSNVGIGTTSPDRLLDVSGIGNVYAKIQSTNSTAAGIELDTNGGSIENWLIQADEGIDGLAFYDLGRTAYRMVIDSSGNVGIGTSTPAVNLQVESSAGPGIAFSNSGTPSSGSSRGDLAWFNSAVSTTALIRSGAVTDNVGSDLQFFTRPAAGSLTERMRITDYGSLCVGNVSGTNLNWGKIQCGGTITVGNSSGTYNTYGRIYGSSTSGLHLIGTTTGTYSSTEGIFVQRTKVGMGTSSPGGALHIAGNGDTFNLIRLQHTGSGTNGYFDINVTDTEANLVANYSSTAIPMRFITGAVERMRIDSSGNVGIGTDSPNSILQLSSTGPTELLLSDTNAGTNLKNYGIYTDTGKLHIRRLTDAYSGYTPTLTIDQDNVGIGTASPAQKLDVVGIVKHQGLDMTAGIQVDQTTAFTKTLNASADTWTPTGIDYNDIVSTGSYLVQVYSNDHSGAGPANYAWYWTGTMSWYASATNSTVTSEIYLNGCGHYTNILFYLRTKVNLNSAAIPYPELEWKSSTTFTNSPNWLFTFRRLL